MDKTLEWLKKNKKIEFIDGSICTFDGENVFVIAKICANDYHWKNTVSSIFEAINGEGIRFCSVCGKPMNEGWTNEDDYCCSNECFESYMNKTYGKGKWRPIEDEDYDGEGCYESQDEKTGEWFDNDWYHTEWY